MEKRIRNQMRTVVPFLICAASFMLQPVAAGAIGGEQTKHRVAHASSITSEGVSVNDTTGARKTTTAKDKCRKEGCSVFAKVDKSEQMMYVYVDGALIHNFVVSTGTAKKPTPNLDMRPAGPVYEKYRSKKYPEGDYKGMGNMPYAVFIKGGYAIHGTTPGSFKKLGTRASHGCIRLHPDDAKVFYDLVKTVGLENTWVTVHP